MKKQYIAIYFYGLLTAMAMITAFHFYIEYYMQHISHGYIPPEKDIFLTEEHWINMFSKYRNELKELEDYYNSIESWNFVSDDFRTMKMGREKVVYIYDEYLSESFIVENNYPISGFLKMASNSRNFSMNRCNVTVVGDYLKNENVNRISYYFPRNLIVKLYSFENSFYGYIYSPDKPLILEESDGDHYRVREIGEGWYYLEQWVDATVICY